MASEILHILRGIGQALDYSPAFSAGLDKRALAEKVRNPPDFPIQAGQVVSTQYSFRD